MIPTWLLLVVWVFAGYLAVTGVVTNDIVGPALLGGLVLIVMLIGFTVMQHAFSGGAAIAIVSDIERRALALTGAGDMIWDWDVPNDRVFTSPETEAMLGLKRGALGGSAADWLEVLHPLDRDRFRAALDGVLEQRRGRLFLEFRLRTLDGHYMWFALKARPVVGSDGEVVRLVGTVTDVTEFKTAEERLLHDAVHDNLTGLPNRELFLDRLDAALSFAKADSTIRPTVMVIDLDRFKQVNDSVGIAVGDSILLTLARRLGRLLKPQDTMARLSGDQFGLLVLSEREPPRITALADTIRKSLRAPITFNDREILLTASIGLALADGTPQRKEDVLKDAELAMYHGKRIGGDRIEVFKPAMRTRKSDRLSMESDLRRALERDEMTVLYQPIVWLEDRTIAGFEALLDRHGGSPGFDGGRLGSTRRSDNADATKRRFGRRAGNAVDGRRRRSLYSASASKSQNHEPPRQTYCRALSNERRGAWRGRSAFSRRAAESRQTLTCGPIARRLFEAG